VEKNVMFLSYDGINDPLGQSQILPYIKGIASHGFKFVLISAEKKYNHALNPLSPEELKSFNIQWIPLPYTKYPPVISTIFDLWKMNRLVRNIIRTNKIELIHCRGYITAIIGLHYKRKKNIPFLFDMRGLFADERKDAKNWNTNNPIYRIIYNWFKKKEIEFFTEADFTISLTKKGKEIICNEIVPLFKPKIEIIPCCVDIFKFNASRNRRNALRNELKIPLNSIVYTYLGSLGTWYMLDEMIDFFNIINSYQPNSYFLFISNELETKIYKTIENKNGNPEKFRITRQPQNMVPDYLSVSDWGLFFILPSYSKQASSPTKLAEFLAMGIPVISNRGVGDVDEIIKTYEAGIIVNGFNTSDYETACLEITSFARKPESYYQEIANMNFSTEIAINRYTSVYQKILDLN
jgi:glycosyltransferase involved in cell wall biosynthesis